MDAAGKRVLVVDDDDDHRDVVVECLNQAGYRARGVSNGGTALEVLRTERPSLVLSDLFMNGMDGTELLSLARRQDVSLPPFVFVTGANASELENIAGTVLRKPFDLDQLLDVVARHCA